MTSYSGLWNNEYGVNHAVLTDAQRHGNMRTTLSRVLSKRTYGAGVVRELLESLVGATSGSNATASHKRVAAERDLEANVLGGKRTIETVTSLNRNTTAADVTFLQAMLNKETAPTYVTDRAGNGGGSKLGW